MAGKELPARPGDAARSKRAAEVREEQIANKMQGFTNVPEEPVEEVVGHSTTGKSEKRLEIEVAGGVAFVHIGGQTVRLEREELFRLEKIVRRAKQAV